MRAAVIHPEENADALAGAVPGLGILDGVLEQAGELGHRLVHPVFLDGSDLLKDGSEHDGLLHDVCVLQKLAQERGEVVGHLDRCIFKINRQVNGGFPWPIAGIVFADASVPRE